MNQNFESKAREIVKHSQVVFSDPAMRTNITNEIAEALRSVHDELVKEVEAVDPLEAIADWEDADSIAWAVKDFIVKSLKEKGPKTS